MLHWRAACGSTPTLRGLVHACTGSICALWSIAGGFWTLELKRRQRWLLPNIGSAVRDVVAVVVVRMHSTPLQTVVRQ